MNRLRKRASIAAALALPCALAFSLCRPAAADSFTDAGGTVTQGIVDVSRTAHASMQCTLSVTAAPATLASLWSAANCASFPTGPQALYLQPTGGGVWYRTDGIAPTSATGIEVFQNGGWWIEGRLSISALQLVSATGSSVAANVEVRY